MILAIVIDKRLDKHKRFEPWAMEMGELRVCRRGECVFVPGRGDSGKNLVTNMFTE
jgi:hypothetical protein